MMNKEERKEYMNNYILKNKEKIALRRRIYEKEYLQRPDIKAKKKEYMKEYRQKKSSKEKKKIQDKKYVIFHKEKIYERQREWRTKNKERLLPKNKINRRNNYQKHREKIIFQKKVYNKIHPLIYKARNKAKYIPYKESCENCGSTYILQKHHPDYLKPLEVITLCINCHAKIKKNYEEDIPLLN